jgi:Cu/Ag efflux pump CusA
MRMSELIAGARADVAIKLFGDDLGIRSERRLTKLAARLERYEALRT